MNKIKNKTTEEMHPLFPSGAWEGFYIYHMGPDASQHKMSFSLNFKEGIILGSGRDNVGGFSWRGTYDQEKLNCEMVKSYATHTVDYHGRVDENGIWGIWNIGFYKGGFHIWPKSNEENEAQEEVIEKEKVLSKKNTIHRKI